MGKMCENIPDAKKYIDDCLDKDIDTVIAETNELKSKIDKLYQDTFPKKAKQKII